MGSPDTLTLHTSSNPVVPTHYRGARSYRQIIGLEHVNTSLWLPGVATATTVPETFFVPEKLAYNISRYFEHYYLTKPHTYRNCHIGAAAMLGVMPEEKTMLGAMAAAEEMAYTVMQFGRTGTDLAIGAQGVFGEYIDLDGEDEPEAEFFTETSSTGLRPIHSVVGLTPQLGIQTDSEQGAFSLISHIDNLAEYQATSYNIELYRRV